MRSNDGDVMYKRIEARGEYNHVFRHAYFSKNDGGIPPRELGCYVLLSKNILR